MYERDSESLRSDPEAVADARQRARAKLEFYKHLSLYLIVVAGLAIVNLSTGPSYLWFLWPAVGWGIGIAAHAMNVFVAASRVLERMTDRELHRERSKFGPNNNEARL